MYDSGVGDLLRVLCQYWSVAFFSAAVISSEICLCACANSNAFCNSCLLFYWSRVWISSVTVFPLKVARAEWTYIWIEEKKNKFFPKSGNHRGSFDQVSTFGNIFANYILKLKIRLSQSLKAIVEVLIKCQHLAAADVSTAPRTINHFRELGIRKSFFNSALIKAVEIILQPIPGVNIWC